MRISVFGMGYVGCVTAACLVKQGHNVIGVDIIKSKIKGLNNDIWPVYEPGLNELNKKQILKEKFFATSDEKKALKETEVGIICVGTPNLSDGSVDIKYVESVIEKVSDYFNKSSKDYTLLVRSTIPPGSTHQLVYNRFKKVNNIQIAFFPEFLREGSAINDFFFPSLKVIGCKKNFPIKIMDKIFPDVEGEWNITNYEIAESLKYISNSWHALKIVFTNEIASVLKEYNLNSEQSMELFCQDKVLNISPHYMKPGFAYGGSCLPKDLNALICLAKKVKVQTPLLNSISISNDLLINRLELVINNQKCSNIGFSGISFKPNTDDLRNSPIITVIKNLKFGKRPYQREFNIKICDSQDALKNFSNDINIDADIFTDVNQMIEASDVIILGPYKIPNDIVIQLLEHNKILIDLKWNTLSSDIKTHENYLSLV